MRIFKLFSILILSFVLCYAQQIYQDKGKRLFNNTEISKEILLPQDAISFHISFVDNKSPVNKGWWFFSRDKIKIEFTITNNSDSIFFIEPPHSSPIGGNPTFSISEIEKDSISLVPENLTIVNFVPTKFIKMEIKEVHKDTVDILDNNSFNFKGGKRYKIKAIYYSQWAAFKDEMDKVQKIWSGTIESNDLEFIYPN